MRLSIAFVLCGLLAGVSAGIIGNEGIGSGWKNSRSGGIGGYNGGNNGNGGINTSNSGQDQGEEVDIFAGPQFPGTSYLQPGEPRRTGLPGTKWVNGKSLAGHRGSNGWQGSSGGLSGGYGGNNDGNEYIWLHKKGRAFW